MLPEQSPSAPSILCFWQRRLRAIWQLKDIGLKGDRESIFSHLVMDRSYPKKSRVTSQGIYLHDDVLLLLLLLAEGLQL